MFTDDGSYYRAFVAKDRRFDGVFFVGVTSTRIYCRPVCPARTPKAINCRFFASAHAAERAGFRPCLRCRPELAPGNAPVDDAERIAQVLTRRVDEGSIAADAGLEAIADEFALSSRQLRRVVRQALGVSPVELLQTRRLLLAKQLLTETSLPMTAVAFASGFSSLRRFNDAFVTRYRMPPPRLRREVVGRAYGAIPAEVSILQLTYRPPYDWDGMLAFLGARTLDGAESVIDGEYRRTVRLGRHTGWLRVRHVPARHAVVVEITHSLTPVLAALLGRLRHLFDLDARPDLIVAHLAQDARLAPAVRANPGLRVPGAFDGFELAVRAVLGQQISVKAATRLTSRFTERFGEAVVTPFAELTRLAPTAKRVARASIEEIAALGIVSGRAHAIVALARAVDAGALRLEAGSRPDDVIAQLVAMPGIGPWTAQYLAMRALRWPDAFPKEDVALRNALGGVTAKVADATSQAWRPWRSYAVLHVWQNVTGWDG